MKKMIGRIVSINNLSIKVEILQNFLSSYTVYNGQTIRVGGVYSIVTVSHFVYQIVSEQTNESKDDEIFEKKELTCQLLGYVKNGEYFEGTDGDTPNIYDAVYTAEESILKKVYSNSYSGNTISVGKYSLMSSINFEFDINKVFASHILIVGNTGSGKSNTLAKLYESLFSNVKLSFSKSKFLFIDTNGEFENSFVDDIERKKIIDAGDEVNGLKFPIQFLDENNWGLILDATEKTQLPVIKSVVKKATAFFNGKISLKELVTNAIDYAISIIISSSVQLNQRLLALEKIVRNDFGVLNQDSIELFYNTLGTYKINNGRIVCYNGNDFADYSSELKLALQKITLFDGDIYDVKVFAYLLNLEYLVRVYKYNVTENNISPMIARMSNKIELLDHHLIPFNSESKNIIKFIDNLFDFKSILIVNMENCSKELKTLFVSLLGEKIYEYSLEKKRNRTLGSYHFIIEEAHNYLSKKDTSKEDALHDNCLELFEKIIKEGRKYGLFMTISTQRPSEINETIISQTHNFFIHKIVNPKDVSIIKSAVPFLDELSFKMLSILSPGQCIVTGTGFKKPNIVQIDFPINSVNSKTIDLVNLWTGGKRKLR